MTNLTHASEESLELYSMGRMAEEAVTNLEEHLLVCSSCQTRLADVDSFIRSTRIAAKRLENQPASAWTRLLNSLTFAPAPVWAAAGAAAVVMLVAVPGRLPRNNPAAQSIELGATRSVEAGAPVANAGAPLEIRLDAAELPASPAYTVTVVDRDGRTIWESQVQPVEDKLATMVGRNLGAGRYWVRVYSDSLKTEQLKEYALEVK